MWGLYLLVGLGSAVGGMARFWLSVVLSRHGEVWVPVATGVANVTGSFLIGFIAAAGAEGQRYALTHVQRSFLMAGVLGGYTTFSSFSLQTLEMMRDGLWLMAGLNVVASVGFCLLGVGVGYGVGQWIR
jgi:CrcB protein